jgi:pleiotropic regulator 1
MASVESVEARLERACSASLKRTLDAYLANYALRPSYSPARSIKLAAKVAGEYPSVKDLELLAHETHWQGSAADDGAALVTANAPAKLPNGAASSAGALVLARPQAGADPGSSAVALQPQLGRNLLAGRRPPLRLEQPEWHAPWKLMRVISGHLGWVRSIAVDTTNEWFATGSNDRTIKIWELASGERALLLLRAPSGNAHELRALLKMDRTRMRRQGAGGGQGCGL